MEGLDWLIWGACFTHRDVFRLWHPALRREPPDGARQVQKEPPPPRPCPFISGAAAAA